MITPTSNVFCRLRPGFVDPIDESKGRIFDLYFKFTSYRVVISIGNDYKLDLTEGGFACLLGFENKIFKDVTNFIGTMTERSLGLSSL